MSGTNAYRNLVFILVFCIFGALPIGISFYKFYFTKNYDYLVEAPCKSLTEHCFSRDCSNPDDCPPNGLSTYKEYYVKAYDFFKCSDNSCAKECKNGVIKCIEVVCGESPDDVCTKQN